MKTTFGLGGAIIEDSFSSINQIEVPRFVGATPTTTFVVHGFAYASQSAYGCCFYVSVAQNNKCKLTLLIAKSRMAPVAQQSLLLSQTRVPSKKKPADVVSRGCLAHELTSTICSSGSKFISK